MLLWQQRRWRTLLNLIDHIPAASHLYEALANNEDVARAWLANQDDDGKPASPRLSEWDPVRAELTVLSDRIGELTAITISAHGGRPSFTARPRPKTAIDRIRDELRTAKHNDLVRRLLPWQTDN